MLLLVLGFILKPALASKQVIVSIKPLHSLTTSLLKGIDEPVLLMKNLQSPHHFHLKPSQAKLIQKAKLVVWVGKNIESPLARLFSNLPKGKSLPFSFSSASKESEHENQHYWLDPIKMIAFADKIQNKLQTIYPKNKVTIQSNFESLKRQLQQLNAQITQKFKNKKLSFVTLHNDLMHFNVRYQLKQLASLQTNDHQKPSIKQVLKIKKILKQSTESCIVFNRYAPKKLLNIISSEKHNKTIEIETMGEALSVGGELYFDLMHKLSNQILSCTK
jgi:zinc transport system substrate-binding protein